MESSRAVLILLVAVALLGQAPALADTVVLRDGTRLHGQARITSSHVRVSSQDGVLTLPVWQVRYVQRGGGSLRVRGALGAAEEAGRVQAQGSVGYGSSAPDQLDARLSVDFDKVPLQEALEFVQRETGVEMQVAAEVREDQTPVDLHLQDVPLRTVLGRLLEPRGMAHLVKADGTVYVGKKPEGTRPRVADVLNSKMTVDFDGVPLIDVVMYIREVTGVNMAIHADVRNDTQPVYLHLKELPVHRVLELLLEPRGFAYAIWPGDVLYVRSRRAGNQYVMRVYGVRDLLVSTEDLATGTRGGGGYGYGGSRGGGRGSRSSGRGGGGSFAPQFGGRGSGGTTGGLGGRGGGLGGRGGGRGGYGGGYGGGAFVSTLTDRSENLSLLIQQACGQGTWMFPGSSGLIDVTSGAGAGRGVGGAGVGVGRAGGAGAGFGGPAGY